MKAPAPTRGDKITIGFGLLSIPVQVLNGVDEDAGKIKRNMQTPAGNAVQFKTVDAVTGDEVSRSVIDMVYTVESGDKVVLSDEEIAQAVGEENGKCDLVGVYPLDQLDRYTVSKVAQVRPQTVAVGKKKTRPYDKPYALLLSGLVEKQAFALLRYTLRGKPHLGALTGDGSLKVLYWEDEVREVLPLPDVEVSAQEVGMAVTLVEALMGSEAPVLANDAAPKVRTYAETKASGTVTVPKGVAAVTETVDLMAALKASVEAAKQSQAS